MTPHTLAAILKIQKHNRALWLAALRSVGVEVEA